MAPNPAPTNNGGKIFLLLANTANVNVAAATKPETPINTLRGLGTFQLTLKSKAYLYAFLTSSPTFSKPFLANTA